MIKKLDFQFYEGMESTDWEFIDALGKKVDEIIQYLNEEESQWTQVHEKEGGSNL